MRLSRLFSTTLVVGFATAATIFACGGGGGGTPDAKVFKDSKTFLDGQPGVSGGLGQLCMFTAAGSGSACPAADACVTLNGLGSTTTGYCTPDCNGSNGLCTAGYTGPAGGSPQCALSTGSGSADGCAIVCTSTAQCPGGMSCLPVSGQSVSICAPN